MINIRRLSVNSCDRFFLPSDLIIIRTLPNEYHGSPYSVNAISVPSKLRTYKFYLKQKLGMNEGIMNRLQHKKCLKLQLLSV